MINLLKSYVGSPAAGIDHLILAHQTLLVYPSADALVILDAHSLRLVRVLAFWEAFPAMQYTNDAVGCISVDSAMKLIVASTNTRIAAWSLSGVQDDKWRIHSSLVLPDDHIVTSLDIKSGLLAVGSQRGLSVYTLRLEDDLPTWFHKWSFSVKPPSLVRFSPSLMFIATTCQGDNSVRIYSTTSGRQTQEISHARQVTSITWRRSQASTRNDLILYTITTDSTLRIFLPVLDSPQHLQLHAAVDLFSSFTFPTASKYAQESKSSVFWLDREIVGSSLAKCSESYIENDDPRNRKAREISDEGWDNFLRVLGDGSLVVTAVANIDRRPPTLLKQFTLHHTLPLALPSPPDYLYLLPNPDRTSITLVTSPVLTTFDLSPLNLFDSRSGGLHVRAQIMGRVPEEESKITRIVRTSEGKAIGVIRSEGGETWRVIKNSSDLVRSERWSTADLVAVLDKGRMVASYCTSGSILTLHSTTSATINLPPISALFSLHSNDTHESILGITADMSVVHILVSPTYTLTLHSNDTLPLSSPPVMIVPVDPMGWSDSKEGSEQAVLLSVSKQGDLDFWAHDINSAPEWQCTGRVSTGRTDLKMAVCSSAKKSALIFLVPDGEELTIWDSKESEFASGLEFSNIFSSAEPINNMDWTSTPDSQSILAVGFSHHVDLLCQQRMTYFDEGPGWATCWKIDIANTVPYPISDCAWVTNGALIVAAGHQMYLYGQPRKTLDDTNSDSLFEYVVRLNGPLSDYHPQILLQCLLWEKIELVKEIIVNLARYMEGIHIGKSDIWNSIPLERFLRTDPINNLSNNSRNNNRRKNRILQFDSPDPKNELVEEGFSRSLVLRLIETLELHPLPSLTPNEQAHLLVLIQTTLEIDEQRRALDANGLRYLISMRSFYILNYRTSTPSSPRSNGVIPRQTGKRVRLRYRDMIWAYHSESQEILLDASIAACNGKMCWSDARALGVFVWLSSAESLKSHLELIARNEYMAGDNRDPTACSLFYFALGKANLVHGLWRQAAWHKEQAVMLKFLSNDFTQSRWRTAALKNAYALLSKQRFEYAAAFFLLGGSLKDATNVCIKQLLDFQLAIALARVVEQSDDGPVLRGILKDTVLPEAFKNGNRWLGSWAFWMLRRRDLAVRILLTPLRDVASALDVQVSDIADPHYDDPSLALLFAQLRSKTLQAAQGTSEISARAEFHFVLQIARVFCRMGCHVLALDLVRSWSFERPSSYALQQTTEDRVMPLNSTISRRPNFLELAVRRRSSILIDMDIPSLPPTRPASPETAGKSPEQETIQEEGDLFARKVGLGRLMKSAKHDVKVPDFDMSAFM